MLHNFSHLMSKKSSFLVVYTFQNPLEIEEHHLTLLMPNM